MSSVAKSSAGAPVRSENYEFLVNIGNFIFTLVFFGILWFVPWINQTSAIKLLTVNADVGTLIPLSFTLWLVPAVLVIYVGAFLTGVLDAKQMDTTQRVVLWTSIVGLAYSVIHLILLISQGDAVLLGFGPIMAALGFALMIWQMNSYRPVLVLFMALVFAIFPIVWITSAALNPTGSLASQTLIPQVEQPSDLLSNFSELFSAESLALYPFWTWMRNSLFIATITAVLTVMISMLAAYAFSRFRFAGRQNLLILVLLIQVFPNMLALVALFVMLQQIGKLAEYIPTIVPALSIIDWSFFQYFGLNSMGGLILVYLGGAMGINTWLMKGFFDSVPRDIDESAQVDGASHWQTFWLLIFPLVRPILAVVTILSFVGTFNEYVLARVLLTDKESWTVMVGLYLLISDQFDQNWGKFAAGALIAAVPIVTLYLLLQDQIVGGLTQGAVKG